MKTWFFVVLLWAGTCGFYAQELAPPAPAPQVPAGPQPAAQEPAPLRMAAELDKLVAPIALFPDPLLALVLPASTVPFDIVLAARRAKSGLGPEQIRTEPWDDSVKALTHYPELLQWLDENIEWTAAVGEAFATQEGDVMQAIQRLRARAKAAGNLPDTPQQEVVMDNGAIRILPAQPDTVSVPAYDPSMVYSQPPVDVSSPLVDYGTAQPAGGWLDYDCDWGSSAIWIGSWGPGWRFHHDHGHLWQRNPDRAPVHTGFVAATPAIPRPGFLPGTPPIHRFGTRSAVTIRGPRNAVTGFSIPATMSAPAPVSREQIPIVNGSHVSTNGNAVAMDGRPSTPVTSSNRDAVDRRRIIQENVPPPPASVVSPVVPERPASLPQQAATQSGRGTHGGSSITTYGIGGGGASAASVSGQVSGGTVSGGTGGGGASSGASGSSGTGSSGTSGSVSGGGGHGGGGGGGGGHR